MCTGFVVNELWVATSRRCVELPLQMMVEAGGHNLGIIHDSVKRLVASIVYPPNPEENDIALVQLDYPLYFSSKVGSAKLPEVGFDFPAQAIFAGWGTNNQGESGKILQKINVTRVQGSTCQPEFASEVCYDAGESIGPCHGGDIGGPLMCGEDRTVCGILGGQNGDCPANRTEPEFYTDISLFTPWIREVAGIREEDESPVFEQVGKCGGVITATSARISYNTTAGAGSCTWIVKGLSDIRLVLTSLNAAPNDQLLVTPLAFLQWHMYMEDPIVLEELNRDYHFHNSIFLITFAAGGGSAPGGGPRSFSLEYFGSGWDQGNFFNELHHLGSSSGQFSYPVGGGQYQHNRRELIVVDPPERVATAGLTFTKMDIGYDSFGCHYERVRIYEFDLPQSNWTQKSLVCGTNLPVPIESTSGTFLVLFQSYDRYTGDGFSFEWN
jgi:hypothetical protein